MRSLFLALIFALSFIAHAEEQSRIVPCTRGLRWVITHAQRGIEGSLPEILARELGPELIAADKRGVMLSLRRGAVYLTVDTTTTVTVDDGTDCRFAATERAPVQREVAGIGTATGAEVAKTEVKVEAAKPAGLTYSGGGYLDMYYGYNLNRPKRAAGARVAGMRPSTNLGHTYDVQDDQLSLSLLEVDLEAKLASFRVKTGVAFGAWAEITAPSDDVLKHLPETFAEYATEGDVVKVRAGKLASHVGEEALHTQDNWNYSHSVTCGFGSPFWHLGLAADWQAMPDLQVSGYLYNGADPSGDDANRGKSFGWRGAYTVKPGYQIIFSGLVGAEGATSSARKYFVLGARGTPLPNLDLFAEALYGADTDGSTKSWKGFQLAGHYKLDAAMSVAARLEHYSDTNGFTLGLPQSIDAFTATLTYALFAGVEVRAEARLDHSSVAAFPTSGGTTENQLTTTGALLVHY